MHVWKILPILAELLWIYSLHVTEAHYIVYILCGILSIVLTVCYERKQNQSMLDCILILVGAGLFSLANALPQYMFFLPQYYPDAWIYQVYDGKIPGLLLYASTFVCGVVVGYFIFQWIYSLKEVYIKASVRQSRLRAWVIPFVILTVIDLLFLFLWANPGIVTGDGMWQLNQIHDGIFINHHPYWHTRILKLFVDGVGHFSGNPNHAVLVYLILQILLMNAVIAWSVKQIYEWGFHPAVLVGTMAFYIFYPLHMIYSASMQKDMTFSIFVFLMVQMYAYIFYTGKTARRVSHIRLAYILFFLSAFMVCLMRNNGWAVMVAMFLSFLLLYRLQKKVMLVGLLLILMITHIMVGPVERMLDVYPTEECEKYGIPLQQMARAYVENDIASFTPEEIEYLDQVYFNLNELPGTYVTHSVDSVKFREVDSNWIADHHDEFVQGYLNLAKKYPMSYVKAWIDLTKGYYSVAGYSSFVWDSGVDPNNVTGYCKGYTNGYVDQMYTCYLKWFDAFPLTKVLKSIGVYVWIVFLLFILAIMRRRRSLVVVYLPYLFLVGTLYLATPVYHEIRYIYPLVLSLPWLICKAFVKEEK